MSRLDHKRYIRQNWSEINDELLEYIVSKVMKLPWQDVVRFRSVCSSWRAAANQFTKPGPLLLLPKDPDRRFSVQLGLSSVVGNVTWDLNWNFGNSMWDADRIVGSSHGWLIRKDKTIDNPYLYDPFFTTRIDLPSPSFETLIQKAVLTGNPSFTWDIKVVIILIHKHDEFENLKLAVWCNGDDSWTLFGNYNSYSDIVWSDSDETLYALNYSELYGVAIEGWKLSGTLPERTVFVRCPSINADPNDDELNRFCTRSRYLVPFRGGILFVLRYIWEYVTNDGKFTNRGDLDYEKLPYRTIKFRVFKVGVAGQSLTEMGSLEDEILFLGGNNGVSLPSEECRGLKPNSIYFTDDYWDRMNNKDYSYGGHDFGVYSIGDGSLDSITKSGFVPRRFKPPPIWVFTDYILRPGEKY